LFLDAGRFAILLSSAPPYFSRAWNPTMSGHRLDPLLTPRSIAFVGASEREGTVGHGMIAGVIEAGFAGELYAVNPKYETI
jgi:hypothetical protein